MSEESNQSVLIVDDEEMIREVIRDSFQGLGLRILEAGNGKEALEKIKSDRIDCVISDVRMPVMSGELLLAEIQKLYPAQRPGVIMMSGYSDLSVERAIQLGAVEFITKPFQLGLLKGAVLSVLQTRSESSH